MQQTPMTLQSMVYADENGVGKYQVQDSLPRVTATQQNLPHIHIPIIPSANQVIPRFGNDLGVYNTKNDILFPNQVLQVQPDKVPPPIYEDRGCCEGNCWCC